MTEPSLRQSAVSGDMATSSPASPIAPTDTQPHAVDGNTTPPLIIESELIPATMPSSHLAARYRATRQQLWEQRARQMLDKYDLVIEPDFTPFLVSASAIGAADGIEPTSVVERIKKPIRMRVHRSCHRCASVFGAERVCAGCEHRRCKKCPRFPSSSNSNSKTSENNTNMKTTEGEQQQRKSRTRKHEQHMQAMTAREPLLSLPNARGTTTSSPQAMLHNRIVQQSGLPRAQRSCHKCQTEFAASSPAACAECGHARCSRCPRGPSAAAAMRSELWSQADGNESSGDEQVTQQPPLRHMRQERVYRKARQRVRWNCDQCSTLFLESQTVCGQCGHERCGNCRRHPPKKIRQDFDPEIVRTLNEKLSGLLLSTSTT